MRDDSLQPAWSEIVRYSPRIAPVSVLILAIVQRCESETQMNGNVLVSAFSCSWLLLGAWWFTFTSVPFWKSASSV